MSARITMMASSMPRAGETMMKAAVFRKNGASNAPNPALTIAAPANPPRRACDEEVGSPHHQVSRSHTIAPTSPAPTMVSVATAGSIPLEMLDATRVSKTRKATKLKKAAQSTATRGDSTRVDTTVAIELAASWNPLM